MSIVPLSYLGCMNQGVRAVRRKRTGLQQRERDVSTARTVDHDLSPPPEILAGDDLALRRRAMAGRFSLAQNDNGKDAQGHNLSLTCAVASARSELRRNLME